MPAERASGEAPLVGVFVGGRARRFGGIAKGLLPTSDGRNVVTRLIDIAGAALPGAPIVLVGSASSYAALGLPELDDRPPGIGPLGGLRALLLRAGEIGRSHVLALACDLPAISAELVRRLGREAPAALAVAPRAPQGPWQALSARYAVAALPVVDELVAAGERALQRLFERLGPGAHPLTLAPGEEDLLVDWDRPEDLR